MVGLEHHPVSPSFWEDSGRISFNSSLCSTRSTGDASQLKVKRHRKQSFTQGFLRSSLSLVCFPHKRMTL